MNVVLDTNVVLYLLCGRLTEGIEKADVYVSVITEMELLSYPELAETEEASIRKLLDAVSVVGLTATVRDMAIAIRRRYRLKLPDAVVAGTALALDAVLLTNDRALRRVAGLRVRPVELS